MRKVISELDDAQRAALLELADLCTATFSAGLIAEVLRVFISLVM
jgi:hypothetical protein